MMARGDDKYARAKAATDKAARDEADKQDALRKKMESGKRKPPPKLSRADTARARRMDEDGDSVKPKKRFGR
jgi:hypothetical protein